MISDKEKYSLINKLKSHTESTVKKIEKQFLPVFHTGKIFKVKQYHFLDKWYVYAGSADEPSKTFSIIYVDEMPYKNLKSRESQNSFISNLPKMVRDNEIYPFLLFINNRFVPWDRIDVKIAIQCMLEGLKSKDVLALKREQFEHLFNTPIQLESGIEFKMSDKLYKWCREYSSQTEIDVLFQYKHKNNITTKPLKDTPYLFRNAVKSLDIDSTQRPSSSLATTVRRELDNIVLTNN